MDAVQDGFDVIILSDRAIDSNHAAIPSLLACSAVHHHLIRMGVRRKVGLVVEVGDAWEVHHFATLLGFGATAINPYLALATIREMVNSGEIKGEDYPKAKKNYIKSVGDGLLKIFSKMGISTLMSYQGAQIFEIIGLNKLVVNTCFTGAISRIEGLGFDDLAEEALVKHFDAYAPKFEQPVLNEGGVYQWKRKGEYHMYNPQTVDLLQKATRNNDYETLKNILELPII
jgi:glutamate synthase (NADPH/NADH) large chain